MARGVKSGKRIEKSKADTAKTLKYIELFFNFAYILSGRFKFVKEHVRDFSKKNVVNLLKLTSAFIKNPEIAGLKGKLKNLLLNSYNILGKKIFNTKIRRISSLAMVTILIASVVSFNYYSFGIEVKIDGKSVGYISSQEVYDSAKNQVEKRVGQILERPYTIKPNISFSLGLTEKDKILNSNNLENILMSQATEVQKLYVITVDGKIIGASQDRDSLQKLLDEKLNKGQSKDLKYDFASNVAISQKTVAVSYLKPVNEIKNILNSNVQEKAVHVVVDGDTVSEIAQECGMKESELLKLNPDVNEDIIKVGDKIVISQAEPLVSVKLLRRVEYGKQIQYNVETRKDPTLYNNKKKVLVDGVKGQEEVTADVQYLNGKEVGRKILNTKVISKPVTEVVIVGTKVPPKKYATGVFSRPTNGIITSGYGYRGSEFHTGVDFASDIGTPIKASDGGIVVFAGWKNDYGNLVIISHGNGIETLYGHCSAFLVKPGQWVEKGEVIARVGSTGRSTGPHVHFEVRVDGKHVNPFRYI